MTGPDPHFCREASLTACGVFDYSLEEQGRAARTLAKGGALRVTLVAHAPEEPMDEHQAAGPVTINALRGDVRV